MARQITITIPESLDAMLKDAAARDGTTPERVAADTIAGAFGVIPTVPANRGDLERELLKGMEGPGWMPTAEEWQKKADDLIARHRRSNVG